MTLPGGWIADLFGYKDVLNSLSALMPRRKAFRFLGAALSDNPTLGVTDVNFAVPFRGTYYIDPLSVLAEVGSELAPFHGMAAAIAYALAQGVTSALFKFAPGAVLTESFTLPSFGTWEVETESTAASAVINGNVSISNTGGASYVFSRVTLNGNITGAKSGASTAVSTLFMRSAFHNGSATLTNTGGGIWIADFGGVGGNYQGNSGYSLNAVSVAGSIISENWSFFGNISYSSRARFAFVVMNAAITISPGATAADTLMISCNFGGAITISGTGNPIFSVDGHTLASMGAPTANTVVTGVQLKTNNANGSIEIPNSAAGNLAGQFLMFGAAGMYTARAIAHLISTSGGTGTLLIDVSYVDASGTAKTIAITTTGLLLSGTAGTEDGATTRVFYHNGSVAITATVKGVTGAGATVRIGIACRREN